LLSGKHTLLRAIEQTDLQQLLTWRNKPEFRRFFREYRELNSVHQQNWFEKIVAKDDRFRMFAITDKSGDLLGATGLCYIDWVNRNADLSIYLGCNNCYIDDKFAPDAANLLLNYGYNELNLHRIWAEIYDFDFKKTALFEALGFQVDGRHRETHWSEGKWHDSLFWGLLKSDWQR